MLLVESLSQSRRSVGSDCDTVSGIKGEKARAEKKEREEEKKREQAQERNRHVPDDGMRLHCCNGSSQRLIQPMCNKSCRSDMSSDDPVDGIRLDC
jgi:hypothetical protein